MSALLIILLSSVFVSYYAVASVGALQPFVSDDPFDSATGVAVATSIGLVVLSPISYLLDHALLRPLRLDYLAPVLFAVLIVVAALIGAILLRRTRWLPQRRGFVALMTTQGALFGVVLLVRLKSATVFEAVLLGIGAGVSFAALLLAFFSLQQRLRAAGVPAPFQQAPLALITLGVIALALLGLSGLIRE